MIMIVLAQSKEDLEAQKTCLAYSVFTLQITQEKIDLGSIQIDFERRLYCDY